MRPVGRAAIPIVRPCAQHISAGLAIATIALRFDHESLDSTDIYLEAGKELRRCVLDRIWAPGREARPLSPAAAPRALVETFNPLEICCASKLDPLQTAPTFDVGQHSSERNIGRHMLRATHDDTPVVRIGPDLRRGARSHSPQQDPGTRPRPRRRCARAARLWSRALAAARGGDRHLQCAMPAAKGLGVRGSFPLRTRKTRSRDVVSAHSDRAVVDLGNRTSGRCPAGLSRAEFGTSERSPAKHGTFFVAGGRTRRESRRDQRSRAGSHSQPARPAG